MPGAAVAASAIVVLLPLIPHNGSTHNDDNDDINYSKQEQQQHRAQPAPFLRGEQDGTEEDKNITKRTGVQAKNALVSPLPPRNYVGEIETPCKCLARHHYSTDYYFH